MTQEVTQALELINQALEQVSATRATHIQLQQAVQTVRMALVSASEPSAYDDSSTSSED